MTTTSLALSSTLCGPYKGTVSEAPHSPVPVKTLNRELCIAPKDLIHVHEHRETLWNIAKATTVVGFLALSALAFVLTSLYAPGLIMGVIFTAFGSLSAAINIYSYSNAQAEAHGMEKKKFVRIAEIQKNLESLSPSLLRKKFSEWELTASQIHNFQNLKNGLKSLIPGFACMIYQAERSHELFVQAKSLQKNARNDKNADQRALQLREAYFLERAASADKITAAYTYGVLTKPFRMESLNEIGNMPMTPPETYAIAHLYGCKEPIFIFEKDKKAPLFQEQVDTANTPCAIRQLSHKIF